MFEKAFTIEQYADEIGRELGEAERSLEMYQREISSQNVGGKTDGVSLTLEDGQHVKIDEILNN